MKAIGYVSTDKQAETPRPARGPSREDRAIVVVRNAESINILVNGGESAKTLQRLGMERLLALVDGRTVEAVIVAKLDRLTPRFLCAMLVVSVAGALRSRVVTGNPIACSL